MRLLHSSENLRISELASVARDFSPVFGPTTSAAETGRIPVDTRWEYPVCVSAGQRRHRPPGVATKGLLTNLQYQPTIAFEFPTHQRPNGGYGWFDGVYCDIINRGSVGKRVAFGETEDARLLLFPL